jgi:Uma2 family endonuclease
MSTRKARVRFTYRDYCLLPEDKRYELIDGELYMAPAPGSRHQRYLFRLARILADFVEQHSAGEVFISPFDVILSNTDVVQPDLVFISSQRQEIITERGCEGAPDLVVEVLSRSTRERDTEIKRKLYANYGIPEYWLVDPEAQTIEVLNLGDVDLVPQQVFTSGSNVTSTIIQELSIPVEQVFRS